MRKPLIILTAAAVILVTLFSPGCKNNRQNKSPYSGHITKDISSLSQSDVFQLDFDFIYREIKENYVNLDYKEKRLHFKWDELYHKYRKNILQAKSEKVFYLTALEFLTQLKCPHLGFYPVKKTREMIFHKTGNFESLLDVRLIEGKAIIVRESNGLQVVAHEIVSINGVPMQNILDRMSGYFYRRGTGIGVKSFILFLKVYFDYFSYFFERCPDSLIFELKNPEGTIRHLTLETNKRYHIKTKKTLNNIDFGFLRKGLPHGKILPGGIGYMKVPTFDVDCKQFHKKIKEIIDKFKENQVKGIIIDVRYNGGGNESFRDLLGFLTHQPIEINKFRYKLSKRFYDITGNRLKREYQEHKVHHNIAAETGYSKWLSWIITPNEEQYLVSLPKVVLCNELSFSSALSFVNACMNFKLATVIGNVVPLDGHGLSKQVFLPSKKYVILYPFHESRNPDFSHLENQSRSPDIKVSQGLEDYWLGIDTQLEKAVDILKFLF